MTRYVALLRGIGPVTHAKMPLRGLANDLEAGGLEGARSLVSTGNLVFASDQTAKAVKAQVRSAVLRYDVDAEVFIRTRRQVQMLLGADPFPDAQKDHPARLGVCFFHRVPRWPNAWRDFAGPERLVMFSNHMIVDYGAGISTSRLQIEKATGARMTQRNWTSVLRIAAALGLEATA